MSTSRVAETLPPQRGPLQGVVVLDLTVALAGPYATFLLAQLGATVIKIENPEAPDPCRNNAPYLGRDGIHLTRRHDDDVSASALTRLRGKYSATLNLKKPAAAEVLRDFVALSDVVVENFSAGTLERLGAGYAAARAVNPRIVYCSVSGFGASGSTPGRKAMDTIIQALSGMMMTSGSVGEPPVRVGIPFADLVAPVFAVVGVLAALYERERTGLGQQIDVSMLGVLTSLVATEPFDLLEQCGVPQRTGPTVPRLAPFGVFRTADGHVAICAPTEDFARRLFEAMDRPDLAGDARFATRDQRVAHVVALNAAIEAFTTALPSQAVVERLEAHGVPAALVRAPADAVRDVDVLRRRETVAVRHPRYPDAGEVMGMGLPLTFSGAQADAAMPAPDVGEHNDLIYRTLLGYSGERLAALRALGAI